MKTFSFSLVVGLVGFAAPCLAQGMPSEARKNIHLLLNQHEAVTRTVTMTREGYVAVTESADPKVAAALREHVQQMAQRLQQGLMVRRHDPAFAEFAAHYADIRHTVEPTAQGLKVTVTGKTPAAIKVAQNHASVVTDFAAHGWEAHDRDHAVALKGAAPDAPAASPASAPAAATCKDGPACCENGVDCQQGGSARKASKTAAQPASQPKNSK